MLKLSNLCLAALALLGASVPLAALTGYDSPGLRLVLGLELLRHPLPICLLLTHERRFPCIGALGRLATNGLRSRPAGQGPDQDARHTPRPGRQVSPDARNERRRALASQAGAAQPAHACRRRDRVPPGRRGRGRLSPARRAHRCRRARRRSVGAGRIEAGHRQASAPLRAHRAWRDLRRARIPRAGHAAEGRQAHHLGLRAHSRLGRAASALPSSPS